MDKGEILQATNKLYKLTLLFPKKEPLRYKMREAGINLLVDIISLNRGGFSNPARDLNLAIQEEFEILKHFFTLAKEQKWVKDEALLELEKEYERIKEGLILEREAPPPKTPPLSKQAFIERKTQVIKKPLGAEPKVSLPPLGLEKRADIELDDRQKKVLKILQEKKELQIGQLSKHFPEISRRTLLRDLEKLSQLGFVSREGDGRGVF